MMDATSGAGTVYPSTPTKFIPDMWMFLYNVYYCGNYKWPSPHRKAYKPDKG
jgi:hypothetical protein